MADYTYYETEGSGLYRARFYASTGAAGEGAAYTKFGSKDGQAHWVEYPVAIILLKGKELTANAAETIKALIDKSKPNWGQPE